MEEEREEASGGGQGEQFPLPGAAPAGPRGTPAEASAGGGGAKDGGPATEAAAAKVAGVKKPAKKSAKVTLTKRAEMTASNRTPLTVVGASEGPGAKEKAKGPSSTTAVAS